MRVNRRKLLLVAAVSAAGPWLGKSAVASRAAQVQPFPADATAPDETTTPGPVHSCYVSAEDGTRLALDLVLPQGARARPKVTTILLMTRYWRGEIGAPLSPLQIYYAQRGYAVVVGDVRGTGASFGTWPYHRSRAETRDFSAVMDWIVQQPWSDGRIVGAGNSYEANTADWMAERNHPALKAIVPRFADYDPYADLYFPGGVPNSFMGRVWGLRVKDLDQNVLRGSDGKPMPGVRPVEGAEGARLLAEAIAEHRPVPSVWEGLREITYRDDRPASWGGASMDDIAIATHAGSVSASGVPIQNWAGWMDAGTAAGAIHRFLTVSNPLQVIIGPWSHGGVHASDPLRPEEAEINPSFADQQVDDFNFIERCLSSTPPGPTERQLHYYTIGEERWKTTSVWPLPDTKFVDLHFAAGGLLSAEPSASGIDTYQVDFTVGSGRQNRWATNNDGSVVDYGDRAAVDGRLLNYTSAPLVSDMEMTGHAVVTLFVTSTHTDGVFFVYLQRVSPDGRIAYLTEGQLRGIHRRVSPPPPALRNLGPFHSFLRKDAQPLVPGEIAEVTFALHPLSVRLPAGSRIRLSISGADADVFARIPPVGDPTLTVHRGPTQRSRISLPTLASDQA